MIRWFNLCWLLVASASFADSSVWVVRKGEQKVFIGGSIHVLNQTDYPLPKEFDQAYSAADSVVFETDIEQAKDVAFQQKMMTRLLNVDGQTLQNQLSKEAYSAVYSFFSARGLDVSELQVYSPQMITLFITELELQRIGMTVDGVDAYFERSAHTDQKSVGFLESLEAHLEFIVTMGKGQESEMVLGTIHDTENITQLMTQMKTAWRTGHLDDLIELSLKPMQQDTPGMYQSLLVDRNNNWLPLIEQMFDTPEVEFVVVGALHLPGRQGVLQMLRDRGYTVEYYQAQE